MRPLPSAPRENQANKPSLYFPRGLPGLESYRWFEVSQVPKNHFFLLLQSREEAAVGMYLLDPFPLFPGYHCRISVVDWEELELNNGWKPLIYTTVSIWDERMFTNLAAPIIVNAPRRKGKQIYLPEYSDQMRVRLPNNPPEEDNAANPCSILDKTHLGK